jgi:hypothetical protein
MCGWPSGGHADTRGLANLDLVLSNPVPQPRSGGVAAAKRELLGIPSRLQSLPFRSDINEHHDHRDENDARCPS